MVFIIFLSYIIDNKRELLLIIGWSFSFLNVFSELTETSSKEKERPCNSEQRLNQHQSLSTSSLFVLNRYPPQGISQHLFPINSPTTQPMTSSFNPTKNMEVI